MLHFVNLKGTTTEKPARVLGCVFESLGIAPDTCNKVPSYVPLAKYMLRASKRSTTFFTGQKMMKVESSTHSC